jgi:hypothetical protein
LNLAISRDATLFSLGIYATYMDADYGLMLRNGSKGFWRSIGRAVVLTNDVLGNAGKRFKCLDF